LSKVINGIECPVLFQFFFALCCVVGYSDKSVILWWLWSQSSYFE